MVSRQLITEILNGPIYPIKKEMRSIDQTSKAVDGYTELEWCSRKNPKVVRKTVCFVSSEHTPRYDVVLGRDYIEYVLSG